MPEDLLLRDSLHHLDAAFRTAPISMAFFNTDGRYIRVNDALCDLLARTEDDLIGRRDSDLTHSDDRAADIAAAWRILRGELDSWQTEKRFVRPNGDVVWSIANLTFLRDDERRPLTWLGQFQDITARKALEDRLRSEADHDPLTGLANRRCLDQALQRALFLASRHGHCGALIYIDLNGFKVINDTYGHDAGDRLLRAAADAMRSRCRGTDTVARVGGDEFAVLLPIATRAEALTLEDALRTLFADLAVDVDGTCVPLTASLGTSWFGAGHDSTAEAVIARADRAMYAARGVA